MPVSPTIALFYGRRVRQRAVWNARLASTLLGVTAIAMLLHVAATPQPIDGLVAVTLVGIAAWQGATAVASGARSAGPDAANDNPPRPRLPPHALWW